jgi:hypothetical protein
MAPVVGWTTGYPLMVDRHGRQQHHQRDGGPWIERWDRGGGALVKLVLPGQERRFAPRMVAVIVAAGLHRRDEHGFLKGVDDRDAIAGGRLAWFNVIWTANQIQRTEDCAAAPRVGPQTVTAMVLPPTGVALSQEARILVWRLGEGHKDQTKALLAGSWGDVCLLPGC